MWGNIVGHEFKNYTGLHRPKHTFLKKVDDMREAETNVLRYARESPFFRTNPALGREWFETDLSDSVLESLFNYLLE